MSNADTTILMAQPPISSSTDTQPQETLLQRGMFEPPVTPGTLGRLDRFEILRLLGEGGMGQVYLAREPRTDTRVAVKILRPQMADDPQSVHRFLTEARHMYRLSHPHILRVLEVSDRKEGPYYVMPYVEGGSLLGQYRPDRPMTTERILAIASQVAEALAHAHAHGLIHRDLKPGNVLLEKDGNAYLTDFGLVRTVFNDSMVDASASHLEGTAPYMSPAVARGEAEDTRCDIYAFGALLYELLTGQPPYTGRTPQIILDQVLKGPPTPLREVNPKASPALVKIAEGCLARELHARYTTMTDVVSDLALAAKGALPLGPHQQEQRRRLPRLAALFTGTLAVAALAGLAVHHSSRQKPPRPEVAGHLGGVGSPSTLPVAGELQETHFACSTNNGALTITKYTGPGGDVTIPSTINGLPVTGIGYGAFWEGVDVTRLTIPASVTSLAVSICSDWRKEGRLLAIVVDEANPAYCSTADGVLFSKDKTSLISCPNGKAGSYVIPSSVTSIHEGAFRGCRNLNRVTIPNSVTNIGSWAFSSCANLTRMAIPASVTSIGENPFGGCGLDSIMVDAANPAYCSSADGVVFNRDKTCIVSYPNNKAGGYIIPSSVAAVGNNAFAGSTNLTNLTMPTSVTNIGGGAFAGCTALTHVSLPDSVTRIENQAFRGCIKLSSITIPNGVTSIEYATFCECSDLANVTMPDRITSIGMCAFYNCPNLTSVYFKGNAPSGGTDSSVFGASDKVTVYYRPGTKGWGPTFGGRPTAVWDGAGTVQPTAHSLQPPIPYTYTTNNGAITLTKYTGPGGDVTIPSTINGLPVTSLGYCAFNRGDLTSLTIPDSVTRFEALALWYCSGLTNLTIPKSVISIDEACFGGCNKLLFFKVDAANPVYSSSVDGVVFNKEKTRLLHYPPGRVGNYVVSDRITSIGPSAFTTCANLTGITISNSVTHIGFSAFSGCSGLTNFIVPASVVSIEEQVFGACTGLNSLVVDAANPVYSSVDGILFNKEKTSLLWYPVGRGGSYSIPDRVAHIGAQAFRSSSLNNVTIPSSVTSIGDLAFHGCAKLTNLTIPENVTNIKHNAFGFCPNLTNVLIPASMASIPGTAFEGCSGLISFAVDAANTAYSSVGGALFNKDKTLLVCCPGGTAGSYEIPLGVTQIGPDAFRSCGSLINVMIPNSVTAIGSSAFLNCVNLKGVYFKGHAPTLGENVFAESGKVVVRYQPDAMGWDAEFGGRPTAVWKTSSMAQGISSILPAFGTNQNGVLRRTGLRPPSQLSNAIALPAIPTPVTAQVPYAYTTNNGAITITKYTGPGGEVTIPNTIDGMPVTGIGDSAFYNCDNLASVTIPSSVISIGGWAFGLCSSLTNVAIPNSVISIGGWAFRDCTNLTSVTIPNRVTNIDLNPFSGCDRLALKVDSANPAYSSSADGILFNKEKTCLVSYPSGKAGSYVIPKGITAISYAAFSGCPNLTSVTIPNSVISMANPFDVCRGLSLISVDAANPAYSSSADGVLFNKEKTSLVSCPRSKVGNYAIPNSVTNIEHQAFCSCVHLTSVAIPDSVTSIIMEAFRDCTDLTSVTIPSSVTSIEWGTFLGCTGLTSVTVSESVTNISSYAFGCCDNLTEVYFKGNAPKLDKGVFEGSNKATVYYQPGTTGWGKEFGGLPTAVWKEESANAQR